jgi:hypothetical protein
MPKESPIEISAYGNILLNSEDRLKTFIETVSNWQAKININMKIRIRGKFATEAIDYCKQYDNIQCKLGSEFIQWRNQAFYDIRKIESKYLIIFLEDHQLITTQVEFANIINRLVTENIDIFQYSWFEHYKKVRSYIEQNRTGINSEILSIHINADNYREFIHLDKAYIVSLTSIFRKEILLNLLQTRRPFLKNYDSRGPFDVEKSPTFSFYLPVKYALPIAQFALCVDDEMGIAGSSAISRGLSNLQRTKRGTTHYSKLSPKHWISRFRTVSVEIESSNQYLILSLKRKLLGNVIRIINVFINTLEFIIFEAADSIRKVFKN